MLKLHIQDDEGKTTVVPVVRSEITIGRKEGNTIRLTERNVSRYHARLVQQDDNLLLEEVSARHGTRVNGIRIDGPMELLPNDVIQIGDYLLALHAEDGVGQADTQDIPTDDRAARIMRADTVPPMIQPEDTLSTSMIAVSDVASHIDDGEITPIPQDEQAELVIVSRNLNGMRTEVTHAPFVIGRTEDNDFQLEHRSISRHHIQIEYEAGTYSIRDLGSANGVKINGDLYKRSDLHRGDEIEMGHVRLRFVAPGEVFNAFDLEQAEDLDDLPVGSFAPPKQGKFALLGVFCAAAVAIGLWVFHFSNAPKTSSTAETAVASTTGEQSASSADENTDESNASLELKAKNSPSTSPEEPVENPLESNPKETVKAAQIKAAQNSKEAAVDPNESARLKADRELAAKAKEQAENKARAARDREAKLAKEEKAAREKAAREKAAKAAKAKAAKEKAAKEKAKIRAEAIAEAKKAKAEYDAKIAAQKAKVKAEREKKQAVALIKKADRQLKKKNYKLAIKYYRRALNKDAENVDAKRGLRLARQKQKADADKAKTSTKTTEAGESRGSKVEQAKELASKAKAAKRASNLSLAMKLFRQCLKVHPGMASCRANLAVILMARGRRCEALKHMRRYTRALPGSGKAVQFKRLIEQFEPQCN